MKEGGEWELGLEMWSVWAASSGGVLLVHRSDGDRVGLNVVQVPEDYYERVREMHEVGGHGSIGCVGRILGVCARLHG